MDKNQECEHALGAYFATITVTGMCAIAGFSMPDSQRLIHKPCYQTLITDYSSGILFVFLLPIHWQCLKNGDDGLVSEATCPIQEGSHSPSFGISCQTKLSWFEEYEQRQEQRKRRQKERLRRRKPLRSSGCQQPYKGFRAENCPGFEGATRQKRIGRSMNRASAEEF